MKKSTRKRTTKKRTTKKRTARKLPTLNFEETVPTSAAAQKTHAAHTALAKKVLATRRKARALYKEAASLLDELVEAAGVGAEFDLGKGRTALIVDNFARRRTQFKRVGFDRFDLDVLE